MTWFYIFVHSMIAPKELPPLDVRGIWIWLHVEINASSRWKNTELNAILLSICQKLHY